MPAFITLTGQLQRSTIMIKTVCRAISALLMTVASMAWASPAEGSPEWGYHGEHDVNAWGDLSPDFASCKLGRAQSPVDIRSTDVKRAKLEPIEFSYQPSMLSLSNDGHTIRADYDAGSFIRIGRRRYELIQFHFHTPSEEEIDGKEFDLGAHLVHRSADGEIAVVAVLFVRGGDNAGLGRFWGRLPGTSGESRVLRKVKINATDLLPLDRGYYTLPGSLTTPPCSENVRWLILKTPVTVSKAQVGAFRKIHPMNNRPVQPLNARQVQASSD